MPNKCADATYNSTVNDTYKSAHVLPSTTPSIFVPLVLESISAPAVTDNAGEYEFAMPAERPDGDLYLIFVTAFEPPVSSLGGVIETLAGDNAGYTQIASVSSGISGKTHRIFYKYGVSEPANLRYGAGNAGATCYVAVARFSGAGIPVDTVTQDTGNPDLIFPAGAGSSGGYVFRFAAPDIGNLTAWGTPPTVPPGYTELTFAGNEAVLYYQQTDTAPALTITGTARATDAFTVVVPRA